MKLTPELVLTCILVYFGLLLGIAWITSRKSNANSYFLGNKVSPWLVVALGMLGDSMSGVTFISVPGQVYGQHLGYLQLVAGYFFGYIVITQVLLPIYYKRNLTSIYSFLGDRLGLISQKTGSFFFMISRLLGAAARLFLTASVIQYFIFDKWGVPFQVTVAVIIGLILIYTIRGGIKTLVWTDLLQSMFLIAGVVLSLWAICSQLNYGIGDLFKEVTTGPHSKFLFTNPLEKLFFGKQFIGGMFIAIAMTGLDQNMMQKNLSCRSLGDAKKNLTTYSIVMVLVNVVFVSMGVMLYVYLSKHGMDMPMKNGKTYTDGVYPLLALNSLGLFAGLAFIIGLSAATFSSADSVLTTLTTSFYIDFLDADNKPKYSDKQKLRMRSITHMTFAMLLFVFILLFKELNDDALINTILRLANYTYGPLLGMFAFAILTNRKVKDVFVPLVCLAAPILCYTLEENSKQWFGGYEFGNELLPLHGLLTFAMLWLISKVKTEKELAGDLSK